MTKPEAGTRYRIVKQSLDFPVSHYFIERLGYKDKWFWVPESGVCLTKWGAKRELKKLLEGREESTPKVICEVEVQ